MVAPGELRKHSFFGGLLDDQIALVVSLMETERFAAGETVIAEGRQNDRIHFILEGRVGVSKNGVSLHVFDEGECFGEMEVLDIMPAEATITTLAPAVLISLSNSALHELSRRDSAVFTMLIMNLARDLSRRLRHMNSLVASPPGKNREPGPAGPAPD